MHTKWSLCLMLLAVLLLSACGDTPASSESEAPSPAQEQIAEKDVPPPLTYDNVTARFSDIVENSEVTARGNKGRIEVTLTCADMDPETEPTAWSDTTDAFAAALTDAQALAGDYECSDVFAQLQTADGTILVSGFGGKVKYNLFAKPDDEANIKNPPTISKYEYDQITVGMRYSEIVEIIGSSGTLESEYGTIGDTHIYRTYTWQGEGSNPGSATISFKDYVSQNKWEIRLE